MQIMQYVTFAMCSCHALCSDCIKMFFFSAVQFEMSQLSHDQLKTSLKVLLPSYWSYYRFISNKTAPFSETEGEKRVECQNILMKGD